MSLYRWFSSSSNKPYLPDSTREQTKEKELEVANANERVAAAWRLGQAGNGLVPTCFTRQSYELKSASSRLSRETKQP